MKKTIVALICGIVFIGAIFTAVILVNNNKKETHEEKVTELSEENIVDDCTDEYEELQQQNILTVNSEEEKISPNCSFILETHYKKCDHTVSQYIELPQSLVNKNKSELESMYSDWEVKKFSSNEIILYKESELECGEHYMVRDKDGRVTVYRISEDGIEDEYEQLEISTEYLTETDKINMKNGIQINGKQELNQFIEDFE